MNKNSPKIFPKNFFWGASTAAHQVEGGNYNDWSVWELAHAKEFAQTAHRRLSYLDSWESIKKQAEDPNNYVSGRGVEHYKRYKEDFDIVKQLNLNAFRFSIEWSRLEPQEGAWDPAEINHYKTYIAELRKRNIEPFLNVWHWTMPVWFTQRGGFSKKSNLVYFDRFVKKIAEELIDDVSYVVTLNEPNVFAAEGYITGQRPPQKKNILEFLVVYRNLWLAHRRAYKILKEKKPSLQIGIASQLANIQAKRPHNFFDELSTKIMRYLWNWLFLERTAKYQDFIGINYYFTNYFTGLLKEVDPAFPKNDLGFYMEPEGLYPIMLRTWSRFKKPIFITENGLADSTDQYRRWWIEETIVAMERAISDGVQVSGYLHWSLLDNFEWEFGYWPHFGLVSVDRTNKMKRTIKPSAKWFADYIKDL
jgi:beta-glucosidase